VQDDEFDLTSGGEVPAQGAPPAKPASSEQPAPEPERQEAPKPSLAEIAAEEILADSRVVEHLDEVRKQARAEGFADAQTRIDTDRAAEAARTQAQVIHDQMENLRVNDPQKFAELMANPKVKKAYSEWVAMDQAEAAAVASQQATTDTLRSMLEGFRQLPYLSKLSEKEWQELALVGSRATTPSDWVQIFLSRERELSLAGETEKITKKAEQDALTRFRAQIRALGIDDSVLEGASQPAGPGPQALQRARSMSDEEWDALPDDARKQLIKATMR